jgi:hypothetical protein
MRRHECRGDQTEGGDWGDASSATLIVSGSVQVGGTGSGAAPRLRATHAWADPGATLIPPPGPTERPPRGPTDNPPPGPTDKPPPGPTDMPQRGSTYRPPPARSYRETASRSHVSVSRPHAMFQCLYSAGERNRRASASILPESGMDFNGKSVRCTHRRGGASARSLPLPVRVDHRRRHVAWIAKWRSSARP